MATDKELRAEFVEALRIKILEQEKQINQVQVTQANILALVAGLVKMGEEG